MTSEPFCCFGLFVAVLMVIKWCHHSGSLVCLCNQHRSLSAGLLQHNWKHSSPALRPLLFNCQFSSGCRYIYTLYLMSDSYLGLDQQYDIHLNVIAPSIAAQVNSEVSDSVTDLTLSWSKPTNRTATKFSGHHSDGVSLRKWKDMQASSDFSKTDI